MSSPIHLRVPWWFGQRAMTLYPFIIYVGSAFDDLAIRAHEQVHWDELHALSWPGRAAWYVRYLWLKYAKGYRRKPAQFHPMERAAYRIQWRLQGWTEEQIAVVLKEKPSTTSLREN